MSCCFPERPQSPCASSLSYLLRSLAILTLLLSFFWLTGCGSPAAASKFVAVNSGPTTPPGSTGSTGTGSSNNSGNSNSNPSAPSFANIQSSSGWGQFGQGPPTFVDCSPSPCDGITFLMTQGINSPSMSGHAARFDLGGTAVYTDALFNNHLIGAYSSQGLPDTNKAVVPSLHDFTYDVYFYGSNLAVSQALEFDVNQFFNSTGFIWGHECRIAGGNEWDVWDNVSGHWTATGIPCYPNSNAWNHVTIKVQRTADNQLLYQSITLNGVTHNLNLTFAPGAAPSNWYGVTLNYQMDGNSRQDPYTVYLDNLTFSYE